MQWFRSYHGAPSDPKWRVIAARAQTQPGVVAAVWWALLDYASQQADRGSVADFDVELCAVTFGWEPAVVEKIVEVLRDKSLIDGNMRIVNWNKRQVKREDDSRGRVSRYRSKKKAVARNETQSPGDVTERNADVTERNAPDTDTDRDTDKELNPPTPLSAVAPRASKKRASRNATDRPASDPPEKPRRESWLTPFGEEWEKAYGGTFPWGQAARVLKGLADKPPDEARSHMRRYATETPAAFASIQKFASTYGSWSPSASANGNGNPRTFAAKFMALLKPIWHLPGDAFRAEVDQLVASGKVRDKARFLELANLLDFGFLRTVRSDDEAIAHITQRINGHAGGLAA